MKAIICKKFAPVSDLVWEEVADPVAGPGEVVVDIKAAGLNYPDNLIVQGLYQFQPERPFSPGHEGAGVVSSVGEGVDMHSVGDSVAFFKGFGAFAEKIVLPAQMAFPIPESFPFHIAAGVFMVYGTSYHALVQRADINKDDEVLVLGAAGGVGLAAVDIAKSFGARVVAAVSTKEKAEVCAGYGVDDVVVYGEEKLNKEGQKAFTKELKSKSVRGGFSIIYDPIGDCFAEPALRSIGWGGTYLVVGFAAGSGITPIMSIIKTALLDHPENSFYLVYGNKTPEDTMFYNELKDLENTFSGRLSIQWVFSLSLIHI